MKNILLSLLKLNKLVVVLVTSFTISLLLKMVVLFMLLIKFGF